MKRKERSPEAAAENRQKKSKTEGSSESSPSKLDFATPEKVLQSLLSPTNLRTFFSDYWEKKPLVIKRQDSAFYGSLFLKKQLEDILKTHKLKYEEDVNVCLYVDGKKELHNGAGRATVGAVEKAVKASGATVQFHQPQRFKVMKLQIRGSTTVLPNDFTWGWGLSDCRFVRGGVRMLGGGGGSRLDQESS